MALPPDPEWRTPDIAKLEANIQEYLLDGEVTMTVGIGSFAYLIEYVRWLEEYLVFGDEPAPPDPTNMMIAIRRVHQSKETPP